MEEFWSLQRSCLLQSGVFFIERVIFFTKSVVRHWNGMPREVVVTLPGGTSKMCRCGAQKHALMVELAVLGLWLNLMLLRVFPNLKGSMIHLY